MQREQRVATNSPKVSPSPENNTPSRLPSSTNTSVPSRVVSSGVSPVVTTNPFGNSTSTSTANFAKPTFEASRVQTAPAATTSASISRAPSSTQPSVKSPARSAAFDVQRTIVANGARIQVADIPKIRAPFGGIRLAAINTPGAQENAGELFCNQDLDNRKSMDTWSKAMYLKEYYKNSTKPEDQANLEKYFNNIENFCSKEQEYPDCPDHVPAQNLLDTELKCPDFARQKIIDVCVQFNAWDLKEFQCHGRFGMQECGKKMDAEILQNEKVGPIATSTSILKYLENFDCSKSTNKSACEERTLASFGIQSDLDCKNFHEFFSSSKSERAQKTFSDKEWFQYYSYFQQMESDQVSGFRFDFKVSDRNCRKDLFSKIVQTKNRMERERDRLAEDLIKNYSRFCPERNCLPGDLEWGKSSSNRNEDAQKLIEQISRASDTRRHIAQFEANERTGLCGGNPIAIPEPNRKYKAPDVNAVPSLIPGQNQNSSPVPSIIFQIPTSPGPGAK